MVHVYQRQRRALARPCLSIPVTTRLNSPEMTKNPYRIWRSRGGGGVEEEEEEGGGDKTDLQFVDVSHDLVQDDV